MSERPLALACLPLVLLAGCASPDRSLEGATCPAFLADGSLLVQRGSQLEVHAAQDLGAGPSPAPTLSLPSPEGRLEAVEERPGQLRVSTSLGFAGYRWPSGELIYRQSQSYTLGLDADADLQRSLGSSRENLLEVVNLRTHYVERTLPRPPQARPGQGLQALRDLGYALIGGRESALGSLVSQLFNPKREPPRATAARFLPSGRIAFCLSGQLLVAEFPPEEGAQPKLRVCTLPQPAALLALDGERVYVSTPRALAAYELAAIDTLEDRELTPLWLVENPGQDWRELVLSPSRARIGVVESAGVRVYDREGQLVHSTPFDLGRVQGAALGEEHLAVQGQEELAVWRYGEASARLRLSFDSSYRPVFSLAPDGAWLALSGDGGVGLWRVP